MSLEVPTGERSKLRVFALNMSDVDARMLVEKPDAAAALLGIDDLDESYAEVLALENIADLGLPAYLHDGYDVPTEALTNDRSRLSALEGYVLIILSLAFRDRGVSLTPGADLTLIATYPTTPVNWAGATPVRTQSARPGTGAPGRVKKPRSDAAMSGIVATIVLVVLAALTYVIVRIAG